MKTKTCWLPIYQFLLYTKSLSHSNFNRYFWPKIFPVFVSGFTYIRNGLHFDYPFIESINSLLPLVDELIVVVGDSHDGTRLAVEKIGSAKIKIIDSVWPNDLRSGGKIFALQAQIGMQHCNPAADWLFSLQADELLHEQDYALLRHEMEMELPNRKIEGFLLRFINFYGDFNHYGPSRRYHQKEIRIVRNGIHALPYRDSQGFRIFEKSADENQARKLRVKLIDATVYHYSYVKNPKAQMLKQAEFGSRWHGENYVSEYLAKHPDGFDYSQIDYLEAFTGSHPQLMQPRIAAQDWQFNYNPAINNMKPKEHLLRWLEKLTGRQWFTYKNYNIVKK